MGTEAARLQERLDAALGPAWGIERDVAAGGMSRVFLVNDARLGRRIVLRALHPDLAADVSARRFDREVRLAARLQHPHVVHTPTEVGTALGTPAYMVPEQVTGDPAMDHGADLYAVRRDGVRTPRGVASGPWPSAPRRGRDSVATPGPRLAAPPRL